MSISHLIEIQPYVLSITMRKIEDSIYYSPMPFTKSWKNIRFPVIWNSESGWYWHYFLLNLTKPFQVDDEVEDVMFSNFFYESEGFDPSKHNARPSYTYVREIPEWNEWEGEAPLHYEIRFKIKNNEREYWHGSCLYLKRDENQVPKVSNLKKYISNYGLDFSCSHTVFVAPCFFHPEIRSWEFLLSSDGKVTFISTQRR